MADDERRSIDDILESAQKAQETGADLVKNAFTIGQNEYYKALQITGQTPDGELLFEGDVADANNAAQGATFKQILKHVYLPNADDEFVDKTIAHMEDPDHEAYSIQQFKMAFGDRMGAQWKGFWKNQEEPLSSAGYAKITENFTQGAAQSAIGVLTSRNVSEDEFGYVLDAARDDIQKSGAAPTMQFDVRAALDYMMRKKQLQDADPLQEMADQGYVTMKKGE